MSRAELNAALERLKREIEAMPSDEAGRKRQLRSLIEAIESSVGAEMTAHDKHGMLRSLRGAIEDFEVSHPRATAILNDIMVTLGNIGI
jgi:predicted component of type VI protein secretion system